jgi:hypothetical protein
MCVGGREDLLLEWLSKMELTKIFRFYGDLGCFGMGVNIHRRLLVEYSI